MPVLIEQSERCLQAVNDGGALGMRQAFVVDASQPVGDAEVARFCQERRVIDEAPERNEAVDAAGVFVIARRPGSSWNTRSKSAAARVASRDGSGLAATLVRSTHPFLYDVASN